MVRLTPTLLLALSIVDQARSATKGKGRMPRTRALRLALAHLHAQSGGDRAPFDAFWRAYAADYPHLRHPIDIAAHHDAALSSGWHALLHALGLSLTPTLEAELAKVDAWQERENKAMLQSAIRQDRRAREYAKDARECHSPNGQNQPKLIQKR